MKNLDTMSMADIDRKAKPRAIRFSTAEERTICSACLSPMTQGVRMELSPNETGNYHLICPSCCEAIGRTAGMVRR